MKLQPKDFKRYTELMKLAAAGKLVPGSKEERELAVLSVKRNGKTPGKKPGTNDFAWYNKFSELIRDSANVLFNEIPGTPFEVNYHGSAMDHVRWPVVGAKITVIPTVGKALDANSPINYQMRSLWLALHRAYRGIGAYEWADLAIVIYAIIAFFGDLARAERIYGVCSHFSAQNRTMPDTILKALGVAPSAVTTLGLADFRYQINRIIAKSGVLCLPKGFSCFEDYITLFGNVFKDSDDIRAQWFMYDNPAVLVYDAASSSTGGSIKYSHRRRTSAGQTFQNLVDDLNAQVDALLSDTDVARMCSDILKAFGEGGVTRLEYLPENYTVTPIKDEIRLVQFHNTVLCGCVAGGDLTSQFMTDFGATITDTFDTLRIYQEGGYVRQSLYSYDRVGNSSTGISSSDYQANTGGISFPVKTSVYGDVVYKGDAILDIHKPTVSDDDIIEMTRQVVTFTERTVASGKYALEIDAYSVYVAAIIEFYDADPSSIGSTATMDSNVLAGSTANELGGWLMNVGAISNFDMHTWFMLGFIVSGVLVGSALCWDIDNYSLVSRQALKRMHDACTLSLFKLENMSLTKE